MHNLYQEHFKILAVGIQTFDKLMHNRRIARLSNQAIFYMVLKFDHACSRPNSCLFFFFFGVIKVVNELSCLLIAWAWFEKRHVYVCLFVKQTSQPQANV